MPRARASSSRFSEREVARARRVKARENAGNWRRERNRRFREALRDRRGRMRAEWIVAPVLASALLVFVILQAGPSLSDAIHRWTGREISLETLLLPLDQGRFAPVKKSLARGDVASARLGEALSYQWNGTESIEGAFPGRFDTVTVAFDVETIFGVYRVEYKCLLRDGEVVGWIDPETENEI